MFLFVTTGQVRNYLTANSPDLYVKKFGHRGRSSLLKLALDETEEELLRKNALRALLSTNLKIQHVDKLLNGLSRVKSSDYLFDIIFSVHTNIEIKKYIIAGLGSYNGTVSEVVSRHIEQSEDQEVIYILTEFCKGSKEWEKCLPVIASDLLCSEFQVKCVNMLIQKQKAKAIPVLIEILSCCDMGWDYQLTDRILFYLESLKASRDDLEQTLIKKFEEIPVDDTNAKMRLTLESLHDKSRGYAVDPWGKILGYLSLIGGKDSLTAMVKVLQKPSLNTDNPDDSGSETIHAILEAGKNIEVLFGIKLVKSVFDVYKRLKDSGEISSASEIPGMEQLLNTHHSH